MEKHPLDPRGLIREAYRIEGITPGECRSIFLDWALSAPAEPGTQAALQALIGHYATGQADHPMTQVLTDGLAAADRPRRRGGWRSRPRG